MQTVTVVAEWRVEVNALDKNGHIISAKTHARLGTTDVDKVIRRVFNEYQRIGYGYIPENQSDSMNRTFRLETDPNGNAKLIGGVPVMAVDIRVRLPKSTRVEPTPWYARRKTS